MVAGLLHSREKRIRYAVMPAHASIQSAGVLFPPFAGFPLSRA
jgi:hypothetical protein